MAGIGIRLNRIFKRHTLVHTLYGSGYSMLATVTPMLVVIGTMLLMYIFLGFENLRYYDRELFSCTILYVFIFSLLAASPFNSVLSKYVGDRIFEERYEDILPCIYVGMALNMGLAALIGIPFHIWAYVVGKIPLYWVFTAFCAYIGLGLCFYQMLYLSIVKAYKKISFFFGIGMILCFGLSLLFRFVLGMSIQYSMLLAITIGFFLIACLEFACAKAYFHENSHHYREVLAYFRIYWKLIFTNFFYILGLLSITSCSGRKMACAWYWRIPMYAISPMIWQVASPCLPICRPALSSLLMLKCIFIRDIRNILKRCLADV